MKIIINKCFGGFGVSPRATLEYNKKKGRPCFLFTQEQLSGPYLPLRESEEPALGLFYAFDVQEVPNELDDAWFREHNCDFDRNDRTDPLFIQVVEELGEAASRRFAELCVIEIPDGIQWEIEDYDGMESVHEKHRSWS